MEEYKIPEGLLYDHNNYWIKVSSNEAVIGLTEYGQSTIGDVLYLETAPAGTVIQREGEIGSIEAGKWVGKLVAPVSGLIEESNSLLQSNPREINRDPFGEAWIFRVKLDNKSEIESLMDSRDYADWVKEQIRREQLEEGVI